MVFTWNRGDANDGAVTARLGRDAWRQTEGKVPPHRLGRACRQVLEVGAHNLCQHRRSFLNRGSRRPPRAARYHVVGDRHDLRAEEALDGVELRTGLLVVFGHGDEFVDAPGLDREQGDA